MHESMEESVWESEKGEPEEDCMGMRVGRQKNKRWSSLSDDTGVPQRWQVVVEPGRACGEEDEKWWRERPMVRDQRRQRRRKASSVCPPSTATLREEKWKKPRRAWATIEREAPEEPMGGRDEEKVVARAKGTDWRMPWRGLPV